MIFGTTYSHKQAQYLNLDVTRDLKTLMTLKFDYIRLCCYWDEIQQSKDITDFSVILKLLDICESSNQKTVLTIGMKAPRFPEFYIPGWTKLYSPEEVSAYTLPFIENTIQKLQHYRCIEYWQVENEPLDPVWPDKRCISFKTLCDEVQKVRKIDPKRKIIINLWGNEKFVNNHKKIEDIADIAGIDLYYQQYSTSFLGKPIYSQPRYSDSEIKKIITSSKKTVWITELQAEPWEKNMQGYRSDNPMSMNARILQSNIKRAINLSPQAILLWGSEYWLWQKERGNPEMWNAVQDVLRIYI